MVYVFFFLINVLINNLRCYLNMPSQRPLVASGISERSNRLNVAVFFLCPTYILSSMQNEIK